MPLYFEGEVPKPGTPVFIVVNEVNHPTGIWRGVLEEVKDEPKLLEPAVNYGMQPGTKYIACRAKLTDPRLLESSNKETRSYYNQRPYVNYEVFVATAGTYYMLKRLWEQQDETRGLKRRLDIERGVWHNALKAMVSSDAAEALKGILEEFLRRIGK